MKLFCIAIVIALAYGPVIVGAQTPVDVSTFTNPLLPSGADPWVISYNGFYYYMNTTGTNLTIWKTRDITDLAHAEKKVVWRPSADEAFSHDIWAPELHRWGNKWYIYYAADKGDNESHRIFVLENSSEDPLDGTWIEKGKVNDATDKWAIDPSVFEVRGKHYLIWSGWEGNTDGEQRIYLARLKNPWTIDSKRVELSHPQYPWEEVGDILNRPSMPHVNVNEGPEALVHGDNVFIVYSASGCWTDYYELGVLEASNKSNLLKQKSWKKFDHPFFKQNPEGKAFGTGHNGFFKSPDGKEDWIIYHANPRKNEGCGAMRSPRIQRFTWNSDGTPDFEAPVPLDKSFPKPSR